ncbi:MAG: AraC family transcriptional regulator, partial [Bacilli bacterium]|nr:AraC family transcriptional regulator [Bacilli bacterium]
LMSNKEKTLLEISYESGFSDPKYMNKMFLTSFGCTPKEYRNTLEVERSDEAPNPLELERIYGAKEAIAELTAFSKRNPLEK